MRLEDKRIVITGAAQGIGLASAKRFAEEGAIVGIADLNESAAREAAEAITASGGRAMPLVMNVTERAEVRAGLDTFVEAYGGLDAMFNNAGMNVPMPFLDITEENFESVMRVNGLGVLIGTQEAAKRMIAQGKGGKIVNTASIAGRQGYPDFAPYCASKSAVIALIQAGARELAKEGITVNGFSPGVVTTPLWDKLDKDLMAMGASEKEGDAINAFSENILLGRPAVAEDITGTTLFLASSDSDYITGQVVAIDGGMVLV
ncbi:SDR family oxidoreductase [Salinisphaera sp.]|uniref:SDR family oxidoreductase n=1 Tax=Salinisphaera sp. TaxID=1914330 RepID=UPI002D795FB2|nr:SDR family oxidoreductase [Salinisphaera sp.]HET7315763.1 SDR family oxidoreductase [Salinisphaera sp.]